MNERRADLVASLVDAALATISVILWLGVAYAIYHYWNPSLMVWSGLVTFVVIIAVCWLGADD